MNNDMLVKLLIFTAGAAIGSAVTWNFLKTKCEQMVDEEIRSVKEHYKMKAAGEKFAEGFRDGVEGIEKDIKENVGDEARALYESYANKYTSGQNEKPETKNEEEEEDVKKPYVISPEEFGENDDYETISLTLYEDGVLTDDDGNIIEDVEGTVGEDSLNHFGEYEEDSVFVRNDERQCDYEILADACNYHDIY